MVQQNGRPVVKLKELAKTFVVKQKSPGLRGSFRAIWKPVTKPVTAVSGISFELCEGEMLAFIANSAIFLLVGLQINIGDLLGNLPLIVSAAIVPPVTLRKCRLFICVAFRIESSEW